MDNNTDRLLDHLLSGAEPDAEMIEVIQGWVESHQHDLAADAGLSVRFNRFLNRKSAGGDRYTRASLRRLQRELNFRTADRKPLGRRPLRLALAGLAAAAAVAGAVWVPRFFETAEPTAPAVVAVSAAPHEIREITLPDGSTVRLKAGTNIAYAIEEFKQVRTISLDGEAFFTVKRDEDHPFVVETKDMTVMVLGTEFNVEAWSDRPTEEVMLATGSVEVRMGESVRMLKPHERMTIDRAGGTIRVTGVGEDDLARVRGINLSFDDVSLDHAFEMIADYYGVRIEGAEELPALDGIVLRMEDGATLSQTLYMLQQINPVFVFAIPDDRVIIEKR